MSLMVTRQERTAITRMQLTYSLFLRHSKCAIEISGLPPRRNEIEGLRLEGVLCLNFPAAARRLRGGTEFNGDVHLGLDRLAIDQGLVKLPFPHFAHHSRHQRETAAHGFQILHASIFIYKY